MTFCVALTLINFSLFTSVYYHYPQKHQGSINIKGVLPYIYTHSANNMWMFSKLLPTFLSLCLASVTLEGYTGATNPVFLLVGASYLEI